MEKLCTIKLSAIHNLLVQASEQGAREGLLLPRKLMVAADLQDYEQIIVTKIRSGSLDNRIRTFVIGDDSNGPVTVCGSLAQFLSAGELTCIISETTLDDAEVAAFENDQWPIVDLGFTPECNNDNHKWILELQYRSKKYICNDPSDFDNALQRRCSLRRTRLSSLIMGLKINKTHPDCLHGSAEIPGSVLNVANISQYRSVSVYNATLGGRAETYAVAMPEGTVMTTGAMASFAKLGDTVNVATFDISDGIIVPTICYTDGSRVIHNSGEKGV